MTYNKDRRNDLVHRACILFSDELAKDVALEGLVSKIDIDNLSLSELYWFSP